MDKVIFKLTKKTANELAEIIDTCERRGYRVVDFDFYGSSYFKEQKYVCRMNGFYLPSDRLTYEIDIGKVPEYIELNKHYYYSRNKHKAFDKLGYLEDREDELGIPLSTIIQVGQNGAYFEGVGYFIPAIYLKAKCFVIIYEEKGIEIKKVFWFSDFGKTWNTTPKLGAEETPKKKKRLSSKISY